MLLFFFNAFFCLGLHLVVGFIPVLLKPLLDDLQRDPHDAMTTQKVLFIKTVKHESMKSGIYLRYFTVWTMIFSLGAQFRACMAAIKKC
jgi:hypothetical protein